ncbi:MAG: hypothetical protein Q8R12_04065 [bacterium]|nr:hypothetical protein [bacterium]
MARRKGRIKIFLWILILAALGWAGFKYYSNLAPYFSKTYSYLQPYFKPEAKIRVVPAPPTRGSQSPIKKFPSGFPLAKIEEREINLDARGTKGILLTSFDKGAPYAVLVDPARPDEKLSQIFDFSTKGFPAEEEFKSEDTPEVSQSADFNKDGTEEIVLDLKDYGAYTDSFGVLAYREGKLDWIILKEAEGTLRPAIFRDGSSVKHASVFRVLDEAGGKALVQIIGDEGQDGNWSWEAEVFLWDGYEYAYDRALSEKILKEQPKRFEDGKPVF